MKGQQGERKKVTDKRKGRDMSKKSSLWGGGAFRDMTFQFLHSRQQPAASRNRLQGWDRKQSMEVIAMAFPEEREKNL